MALIHGQSLLLLAIYLLPSIFAFQPSTILSSFPIPPTSNPFKSPLNSPQITIQNRFIEGWADNSFSKKVTSHYVSLQVLFGPANRQKQQHQQLQQLQHIYLEADEAINISVLQNGTYNQFKLEPSRSIKLQLNMFGRVSLMINAEKDGDLVVALPKIYVRTEGMTDRLFFYADKDAIQTMAKIRTSDIIHASNNNLDVETAKTLSTFIRQVMQQNTVFSVCPSTGDNSIQSSFRLRRREQDSTCLTPVPSSRSSVPLFRETGNTTELERSYTIFSSEKEWEFTLTSNNTMQFHYEQFNDTYVTYSPSHLQKRNFRDVMRLLNSWFFYNNESIEKLIIRTDNSMKALRATIIMSTGKVVRFVCNSIRETMQLIKGVLTRVGVSLVKLGERIRALFRWDSVMRTRKFIVNYYKGMTPHVIALIRAKAIEYSQMWYGLKRNRVDRSFNTLIDKFVGNQSLVDLQNGNERLGQREFADSEVPIAEEENTDARESMDLDDWDFWSKKQWRKNMHSQMQREEMQRRKKALESQPVEANFIQDLVASSISNVKVNLTEWEEFEMLCDKLFMEAASVVNDNVKSEVFGMMSAIRGMGKDITAVPVVGFLEVIKRLTGFLPAVMGSFTERTFDLFAQMSSLLSRVLNIRLDMPLLSRFQQQNAFDVNIVTDVTFLTAIALLGAAPATYQYMFYNHGREPFSSKDMEVLSEVKDPLQILAKWQLDPRTASTSIDEFTHRKCTIDWVMNVFVLTLYYLDFMADITSKYCPHLNVEVKVFSALSQYLEAALYYPVDQVDNLDLNYDDLYRHVDIVEFGWWFQGILFLPYSAFQDKLEEVLGKATIVVINTALFNGPSAILTVLELGEIATRIHKTVQRGLWFTSVATSWLTSSIGPFLRDFVPFPLGDQLGDWLDGVSIVATTLRVHLQMALKLIGFVDF